MSTKAKLKIWEENCPVLAEASFKRKYQVQENIIGEGSFGTVISAKCRATQEIRAIKAIRRIEKVGMLAIELELLTELGGHFNIVKLFDFYHYGGSVALVLEYFPHCQATELLYHSKREKEFALFYFRNLLSAVAYLHQNGYVHRDIKLSNFLYSPKTKTFRLVDFGLATVDRSKNECPRSHAVATMERDAECQSCKNSANPCMFCRGKPKRENYNIVGTPGVRAPELLLGIGLCDPAIDIFSCGIVLLSLVCTKHPFFTPKDESENIMNLAFLLGSEAIENIARREGIRVHLSEKVPPADYFYLFMSLRFGFDDVQQEFNPRIGCKSCKKRAFNNSKGICFCRPNHESEIFRTGKSRNELWTIYTDLLYLSLEPDRTKRYNADKLLRVIESYESQSAFKPKPLSNQDDV